MAWMNVGQVEGSEGSARASKFFRFVTSFRGIDTSKAFSFLTAVVELEYSHPTHPKQ